MSKNIDTLVEDIYHLFGEEPHVCDPERVAVFGQDLAQAVSSRLAESRAGRDFSLRMSNIGKPARQLWFEKNMPEIGEKLEPYTKIKFLFGDILEHLLLFLAKEAGHEVSHEQGTVEVDGVVGHNDAVIDDVVVDVKSASKFSFAKFKSGELRNNDPFGYMEQLASYSEGLEGRDGAFLAIDKERGHVTLMPVPREELQQLDIKQTIADKKEALDQAEMPDRCYDPIEHGKSGNLVLNVNCSYCPFKFECWKDSNDGIGLRTFLYSTGPTHFVRVEKEPNVQEVTF